MENTHINIASAVSAGTNHTWTQEVYHHDKFSVHISWSDLDSATSYLRIQGSNCGNVYRDLEETPTTMISATDSHFWNIWTNAPRYVRVLHFASSTTTGLVTVCGMLKDTK